jgi:hypothetical protein
MRVLKTVEETRRRWAALVLAAVLFAAAFLTAAFSWWIMRPGIPLEAALGVSLPPGSRRIHEEYAAVDPEAPYRAIYVSSSQSLDQTIAQFAPLAVEGDQHARRFVLHGGALVTIAPAEEVPATRLMPIRPVSGNVPLGTGCWIIVTRGTPPAATWTAAVPPDLGES